MGRGEHFHQLVLPCEKLSYPQSRGLGGARWKKGGVTLESHAGLDFHAGTASSYRDHPAKGKAS